MNFKHLSIVVDDLEKSIDFYEKIAQLTIAHRFTEGDAQLAFLTDKNGGTQIELIAMPQMQKFEGKGFFLCFGTNKLDDIHSFAKNNGYNPSEIKSPNPKARYFYVYDPSGVSVQLREYL